MNSQRVCVIGAGPSGITAIKNIADQNIDLVAYDYNSDVGGNWIYNEDESHSSVFETTHIISSKTLSQYEDFPFNYSVSDYPSHEELRNYFQSYAKHFNLYKFIEFNTLVKSCNLNSNKLWEVITEKNGKQKKELFTDLVVCNGHHWNPRYPNYPGEFTGEYIHSHQFKKANPYSNKKVLVIGGGNSACDVAVETSRVSSETFISWRRGYRIVPKFIMGVPSDVIASRLTFLPVRLKHFLAGILAKIAVGSNKNYGLQEVSHNFGATHPTINSELLYKIRHGKVKPKPDIKMFEGNTVHFVDGSSEKFDSIIACTGYILSHPFFKNELIDYSSGPVDLYLKMFHPKISNLYFIGMFQPLGCIWPGAEQQSRLLAKALTGDWVRPKNIKKLCEREVNNPHIRQVASSRHTITVDFHKFMKELKHELKKAS